MICVALSLARGRRLLAARLVALLFLRLGGTLLGVPRLALPGLDAPAALV